MSFGSLRLRLLLAGALSILAALALSGLGLMVLFERHVERRLDGELNVHLNQLVAGLDLDASQKIGVVRAPADPRFERPLSGLYWQVVLESNGAVLRSRSLWDFELQLPPEDRVEAAVHRHLVAGPGQSKLYLVQRRIALPARLGGGTSRAAVALDAAELRSAVWRFASDLVPFLLLIGTLLAVAAWAQVSVGLRPLAAVRRRLAAIRSGAAVRIGSGFPDEVEPLAQEIDALLDARDRQVAKARARAADLAHGLRTPLQVLAGEIEQLDAKGETEISRKIEGLATAMQRHVERELTRARLRADAIGSSADVRVVVERVVGVVERTPDGQRLFWSIDVPPDLVARIDADDLAEALGNLIENGAKHARSNMRISARAEDGMVIVTVADDGRGIPEDRRHEVLTRGVRLDASTPGDGLGLAIVADIAEVWNATLEIDDAEPGLRVSLRIPHAVFPAG